MINIFLEYDNIDEIPINENWVRNMCSVILNDNNHYEAKITIIFTQDVLLRKLKKEYFGEDVYTDTISFNLEEKDNPIEGEIYISIDRVYENAKLYKQKYEIECKRVIIHSFLHLLGYDDKNIKEKNNMKELEEAYLSIPISEAQYKQ